MANSFRQAVDSQLSAVSLSPELRRRISHSVAVDQARPRGGKRPLTFARVLAAGLAAVMTFAFGITAMAAVVPSFEKLLLTLGDVRALLQPVNLVSEDAGVRMEVVAAINDGDTAYVYLTLQDIEGTGLVDENTVLRDIQFVDDFFNWSDLISYDAETGIATYRMKWDDAFTEIRGQKVSLTIDGLLLGQNWLMDEYTGYTLADILAASPVQLALQSAEYDNHSMTWGEDQAVADGILDGLVENTMPMLAPGNLAEPLDAFSPLPITSAGVVDGLLHLQVENRGDMDLYNELSFSLSYPGKQEQALSVAESGHGVLEEVGRYRRFEYQEWVLELPAGVDSADVKLMVSGTTHEAYLPGSWSVTFTMESDLETLAWDTKIDMGGWSIDVVELSPMGVTVLGRGEQGENDPWLDMQAILWDGTIVQSDSSSVSIHHTGAIVSKIGFYSLVDPQDVEKVVVNGQEFYVADAHPAEPEHMAGQAA